MGAHLTALLARAEAAADLVGQDPAHAYGLASEVALEARRARDWDAAAVALRAAARAASWQGRNDEASSRIRSAITAARRTGAPARLAEAQTTAAHLWFLQGARTRAMASLDNAGRIAVGEQRLKVDAQRAVLLWHMGRHREADTILEHLRIEATGELRADALVNLGGLLAEQGRFDRAEAALVEAAAAYDALGLHHDAAAIALHNLALVYADSGRIPDALRAFADVERRLEELGVPATWVLVGQTQVLLRANLVGEALEVAERTVAGLDRRAPADLRGEAWSRLATARLRSGDAAGAVAAATSARRCYQRLGNGPRAAMAGQVHLRALALGRGPSSSLLARATAAAGALDRAGLAIEALDGRIDVIELSVALGRVDGLSELLVPLRSARRRGPAVVRARAWYGEAVVLATIGDGGRAQRALERGLRLLDEHRRSLGSTELRAQASGHGAAMAQLGVRLALADRRATAVLRWAERWRAGVVWRRPELPAELAEDLVALRRVRAEREHAAEGDDIQALLRREERLEQRIRATSRSVVATAGVVGPAAVAAGLRTALGDAALVEIVEDGGQLHAVVVAGGRSSLHQLGRAAPVADALASLAFALRRLGRSRGSPAALAAGRASADDALARLDAEIVAPLRRRLGDRAVVVVPTAELHAVPWPALPGLRAVPVVVAPSSTWWSRRVAEAASGGRAGHAVALVAGPGLPGAAAEVDGLHAVYPGATVLAPGQATAAATAAALDGAFLAHLACHGQFRADNPLFSSLLLHDGPLTVYDLERLHQAPTAVVLSACDSGVSASRPGDELLGLLSSLFALGTSTVVASVVPVPDLETTTLMVALHARLVAGATFAEALHGARSAMDPETPAGFVTSTAFVCFGYGGVRVPSAAWQTM